MTITEIENKIRIHLGINPVDFIRCISKMFYPDGLDTPIPADKMPRFSTIDGTKQNVPERLNTELGNDKVVWNEQNRTLVITNSARRTIRVNNRRVQRTYRQIWTLFMVNGVPTLTIWNEQYADLFSMNWNLISANSTLMQTIENEYINRYGGLRPEAGFDRVDLINFMATSWRSYVNSPLQYKQEDLTCELAISPVENNEATLTLTPKAKGVPFVGSRTFIQINAAQKANSLFIQRRNAKLSSDFNKRDCETVYNTGGDGAFTFYAQENFTDANGNYVSAMSRGNLSITGLQAYNYYNE